MSQNDLQRMRMAMLRTVHFYENGGDKRIVGRLSI